MAAPDIARITYALFVFFLTLSLSWISGGPHYFSAVASHLPARGLYGALGTTVAMLAVILLLLAFLRPRRLKTAVWLFPMMGSYPTPWYCAWGFGYALASRRVLGYLLVFAPLAASLVDTMFMRDWSLFIVVPAVFALAMLAMISRTTKPA